MQVLVRHASAARRQTATQNDRPYAGTYWSITDQLVNNKSICHVSHVLAIFMLAFIVALYSNYGSHVFSILVLLFVIDVCRVLADIGMCSALRV